MHMVKHMTNKKLVGYMMYAVAIIMPLSNLPQIIQIFSTKVVTGISLFTWGVYFFMCLVPLAYAVVNNLKPLIISNILWTVVNVVMIYGIIAYTPDFIPQDFERLLLINNLGKALSAIGLILVSSACALYAVDLMGMKHGKKQTA